LREADDLIDQAHKSRLSSQITLKTRNISNAVIPNAITEDAGAHIEQINAAQSGTFIKPSAVNIFCTSHPLPE